MKSPPWIMKLGMILWKELPAYLSALPLFSMFPWQRVTKFSTVLGTVAPNISKTMSPDALPPISMENVTLCVTFS